MRDVIRSLKSESTVLVSSHILSEISQTCDRLLVLNQGRLVAQGTETELAGRFHIGGSVDFVLRGEASAIRTLLEAQDGVKKVIDLGTDGDNVRVRVSMAEDVRETLVDALVGAHVGVRGVSDAHDELEGIFLDLTATEGEA